MTKASHVSGLEDVLDDELTEIQKVRRLRAYQNKHNFGKRRKREDAPLLPVPEIETSGPTWQSRDSHWVKVNTEAHDANLVGLAFSGGGIRSATFNLGVLQALAELDLLGRVDYLSTVSGGGYIGGWLVAWAKRLGSFWETQVRLRPLSKVNDERIGQQALAEIEARRRSFADVQNELTTNRVHKEEDNEPTEVRFLRIFGNYLTPRMGLVSGDTLAVTTILLRNVLLNLTVLIAAVSCLLFVPHVMVTLVGPIVEYPPVSFCVLGVLLSLSLWGTLRHMIPVSGPRKSKRFTEEQAILLQGALPLVLATFVLTPLLWEGKPSYGVAAGTGAVAWGGVWLLSRWMGSRREVAAESGWTLLAALLSGGLAGSLCGTVIRHTEGWNAVEQVALGVPALLGIFLLSVTFYIGVLGRELSDRRREWWGRFDGWLLLMGIGWLTVFGTALYFKCYTETEFVRKEWAEIAGKYLTATWIIGTAGGIWFGNGKSSGKGELGWKDRIAKSGPYVFMVGLLCWLSYLLYPAGSHWPWTAFALCAGITALFSWRVDINQFSMHSLYKNRLVRCYLGASHKRSPNTFTGFDPNDDMPLKDLRAEMGYDGPYPIFNASLNLTKGQDLAWQERLSASFIMTPLYCGYDVWLEQHDSPMLEQEQAKREDEETLYGYRRTEDYASPALPAGLSLGTAMAISGAAADPNMGYYTTAPVKFLLAFFNVRLGQWLTNPKRDQSGPDSPSWGFAYLLKELITGTTDTSRYVHLSDGGHFENLGIYELVKRRCGLIIVCDAEEDPEYKYRGLGTAIRMCRIDMGIEIDLDVSDITPVEQGKGSRKHYAVGQIHYEKTDLHAPTGTIVYIKPSLVGKESTDVATYHKRHPAFPHESTADQWFSESQFEAYRKLGHQEIMDSFGRSESGDQPDRAEHCCYQQLYQVLKDFGFDVTRLVGPPETVAHHA